MDKNKRYVTELSRSDLAEIAAAANMYPSDGVEIQRNDDGIMIGIDKMQIERWIMTVIRGGHLQ